MSFVNVFGGTTIYPADVAYRALALTANTTLEWPTELASSANILASIMDVTPAGGTHTIRLPAANLASVGETALFFNVGAVNFIIADNGGNTLVTVAPGLAWQVYLTNNVTANGVWRSTQYGAGTSSATAGSLVGAGIKAIGTTLNQSMPSSSLNTNYVVGVGDRAQVLNWTGGAGTFTLPSAATAGADWFFNVRNSGTGSVTISPSVGGQFINGGASLVMNPGDSAVIFCDSAGFFTVGLGKSAAFAFDFVSIDLTGQPSPYTLSGANLNRIAYRFTGTITGNMDVIVPATVQQYWFANETSLASAPYTITLKTAAGLGVNLSRNQRAIVYCDGTNVVDADTGGISIPLNVAQGGTGATTESGARTNLGATSIGNALFTAATTGAAQAALGTITVPNGGTGATTLTGVVKGNGTSAFTAGTVSLTSEVSGTLPVANGGTGVTTSTGTGSVVLSASPSFTGTVNFGPAIVTGSGVSTGDAQFELGGNRSGDGPAYMDFHAVAGGDFNARVFRGSGANGNMEIVNAGTGVLSIATNATEKMRITAAGNVGIGTTAPVGRLQLAGTGSGSTSPEVSFENQTATTGRTYSIISGDGGPLRFQDVTAGSERMRIDSSGNVGIGTSTPDAVLDVNGSQVTRGDASGFVYFAPKIGTTPFGANYDRFEIRVDPSTQVTLLGNVNGGTGAARALAFLAGTNERMRIDASGNVGIGTSGPTAKLDVLGDFVARTNASGGNSPLNVKNDSTANNTTKTTALLFQGTDTVGTGKNIGLVQCGPSDANYVASYLAFQTRTADALFERMRITSDGKVGIGTASPGVSLDVVGGIRARGGVPGALGVNNNGYAFNTPGDNDTGMFSSADGQLEFYSNNGEVIRISSTGLVGIGNTSPTVTLDVTGGIKTSRTAVTAPATSDGNIFSGTYTPTLTNVANIDIPASTAYTFQYMRVGNVVTVSGKIDVAVTSGGFTRLNVSLPISSNFSATENCAGTAVLAAAGFSVNIPASISADTTSDVAQMQYWGNLTGMAQSYYLTFTYRII